MSVIDFMYTMDIRLGELLALFLQGDDDKVYIYLYNGSDDDIIFSDIRIIDGKLTEYLNINSQCFTHFKTYHFSIEIFR